ncbi:MAG: bacteriophage abortive infection AbiH family protein [Deltaproteobacteria bacterium]|jgi:hypothetical protein|nr:bacteriophage abortive infection AbiH family protein [Deltaproteobacteria bacterium]
MEILVVGNGFDLEHGLPTSYIDFLKYCTEKKYLNKDDNNEFNTLRDEFSRLVIDNMWLKYFLEIESRNKENRKKTWIDFENEIYLLINSLNISEVENGDLCFKIIDITSKLSKYDPNLSVNYGDLQIKSFHDMFKNFPRLYFSDTDNLIDVNIISEFFYDQLCNFIRLFEIYCIVEINVILKNMLADQVGDHEVNREKFSKIKFDCVLSFNYTNTYPLLYGNDGTKYCYIHGKAQEDSLKTNLVIGINDYLVKGKESEDFLFVKLKKYFQRIIKKTGSEYKDWLNKTLYRSLPLNQGGLQKIDDDNYYRKKNTIHFVGHSLDKTDYESLYEIVTNNRFKIIFYYYCNEDFIMKVQKVIKLLSYNGENGRDILIKRVHGEDWSIKFVDQYDEKEGLFARKK